MIPVPVINLNDGHAAPQLGFGVFLIEPENTAVIVSQALEIGYRHIDTAEMYRNEKGVGAAVAASGLDRSEVFVTSKLSNACHRPDDARKAFADTMQMLGFEYIDLFLIHWPLPTLYDGDFVSTWKVLEEFQRDGRARSIGVSNFQPHHLERLRLESGTTPAVNQVETHPYLAQHAVRQYGAEHGIARESWSPLGRGTVLDDPVVSSISQRLVKSSAQVVLRWHVQRGDIVIPKSATHHRMRENFELFDFELDSEDMARINALNKDQRIGDDPDTAAFMPA